MQEDCLSCRVPCCTIFGINMVTSQEWGTTRLHVPINSGIKPVNSHCTQPGQPSESPGREGMKKGGEGRGKEEEGGKGKGKEAE